MRIGDTCVVHGLRGRADLNGTEVVLLEYLESDRRWGVQSVSDASCHLSLKPDNLDVIPPSPCTVRLWLNPSLLPHADNLQAMRALSSIGLCTHRDDPRIGEAVQPFEMSPEDLLTYEAVDGIEPASVAMLRLICWLLVAPSTSLRQLSTAGSGQAAGGNSFDRGAVGRALISVVDYSQTRAGAAPRADLTATLLRWRAAFARRFGVRLEGTDSHARWTRLQLAAHMVPPAEMLPGGEPDAAAVAARASSALLQRAPRDDDGGGDGPTGGGCGGSGARADAVAPAAGVHVEGAWLCAEATARVRMAAGDRARRPEVGSARRLWVEGRRRTRVDGARVRRTASTDERALTASAHQQPVRDSLIVTLELRVSSFNLEFVRSDATTRTG